MKPKKFIRVNPFIPVKNLKQTLDYYRDKLGFYEQWMFGEMDGGIRRDDMRLVFCEDPDYINQLYVPPTYQFTLLWFVENVDEIYKEFKERGIEIKRDIENKPWGIREFAIEDINGYLIRISEGIEEKG
jgi:uncharacterized glyoxalase superfamily protein PhnB